MNIINDEFVKAQLDIEIGIYALEEIYNIDEFDIIDCFDVCQNFVPANYVISRETYIFSS